MRVFVCQPGKDNEMCTPDSIRIWFPYAHKLVKSKSIEDVAKPDIPVKKGEIVFIVDPGCLLIFNEAHAMRHRFQNKPPGIRKILSKYPGFYLLPTHYHPRRKYFGGHSLTLGLNIHEGRDILKEIHCNAQCDEGQLIYFKSDKNAPIYSKIFVDGAKCEWMKICVHGTQGVQHKKYHCYDASLVNVYVRNGFVVMPGA
ncbi:hypothetical protein GCK32_010271, partial [Trichostrongylus colubriformis]